MITTKRNDNLKYYRLKIVATDPQKDIWLADNEGHLIQKEIGTLVTDLLPGECTVSFGLRGKKHKFNLNKNLEFTQIQLERR